MERKLGISIYPDKSDIDEMKEYIDKMSKYGYKRIFSNLLLSNKDKKEIENTFKEIFEYAKNRDFEIIVDTNEEIFKIFDVKIDDLRFFKKIGADGIRIDGGFNNLQKARLSQNKENLKIEINMSSVNHCIDEIFDYGANRFNLLGCHNFYPQRHSGISLDFFRENSIKFNQKKIRTAAFISSQNKDAFGPWPITEGLPSLEMHRNLPMDVQLKHLILMDLCDDIIISNCYPTDDELNKIKNISLTEASFDVELLEDVPDIMKKIVLESDLYYRGDISDYLIRSTNTVREYEQYDIPIFNPKEHIEKGSVIINSNEYGQYKGELEIAKEDFVNTGKSNVVGKIRDEEIFLLDYLKAWQKFTLKMIESEK